MNYVINKSLSLEEGKMKIKDYSYGLMYCLDKICLDKIENLTIDFDNMTEARFFDSSGELHFLKIDGSWRVISITDDIGDESLVYQRNVPLAKKYREIGRDLQVKEYLGTDIDGQVYIDLTRLCGIK